MESWELEGFVPNVVFPTALLRVEESVESSWLLLYGAADSCIGVATISTAELRKAFA